MGSTSKTIALLLGVAAGAALTAFAFTKKGKKTREELTKKAGEFSDEVLSAVRRNFTKV